MPIQPASIAIILNDNQSDVLLLKRRDVPVWVLPGGGIENGENPADALLREVKEETGLQVRILRKCAEYSPANCLSAMTHVFVCQIEGGALVQSPESRAIAFHSVSQLPPNLFPPHAIWFKEAMSHSFLLRRSLTEISYWAFAKYFLFHPWQVIRFVWTLFLKKS